MEAELIAQRDRNSSRYLQMEAAVRAVTAALDAVTFLANEALNGAIDSVRDDLVSIMQIADDARFQGRALRAQYE